MEIELASDEGMRNDISRAWFYHNAEEYEHCWKGIAVAIHGSLFSAR